MHILVTGASGLLGSALLPALQRQGHHVRTLRRANARPGGSLTWNPTAGVINLDSPEPLDAVVHLAGENIAQRWTRSAKQRIRTSRVEATRLLCHALAELPHRPRTLVAASAIGIYGQRGAEWLDETSPPGTGFLAELCRDWEAATIEAEASGIRVVHLRFGIVLARQGGALAKMLPAFRLGLGGRLGPGKNYWSWIAIEDVLGTIEQALTSTSWNGPFNMVAPEPVTNREFTKTLGRVLGRPTSFPVPGFVVKLFFGEMGREALLGSARVKPEKLLANGFAFQFPTLEEGLRNLLM